MKKFILSLIALIAAFGSQAITVSEAFDQIAAMPGAAVSDMPDYDVAKEGLDWGKVVILIGKPMDATDAIVAQITDKKVKEFEIDGHQSIAFASISEEENKALVLVVTKTPMGPVVVLAQGGNDAVSVMTE